MENPRNTLLPPLYNSFVYDVNGKLTWRERLALSMPGHIIRIHNGEDFPTVTQ